MDFDFSKIPGAAEEQPKVVDMSLDSDEDNDAPKRPVPNRKCGTCQQQVPEDQFSVKQQSLGADGACNACIRKKNFEHQMNQAAKTAATKPKKCTSHFAVGCQICFPLPKQTKKCQHGKPKNKCKQCKEDVARQAAVARQQREARIGQNRARQAVTQSTETNGSDSSE